MGLEADILAALAARVNGLGLGLPVAWPNVTFDPPDDGKYIAASFMPNGNSRIGITSTTPHRFRGLLQLSVYWPRGAGEVAPLEKAREIADSFTADTKIAAGSATVRITKDADVIGVLTEAHAVHVPVSIEWEAFS